MKKSAFRVLSICVLFVILCAFVTVAQDSHTDVCYGFSVLDILTPEVIDFYESEISQKQVASQKSQEWLERVADRYEISVQKVKAVLIVQDFCALNGENVSFADLAKLSDYALFETVKSRIDGYLDGLSEEEKENLKNKASELLSIKTK